MIWAAVTSGKEAVDLPSRSVRQLISSTKQISNQVGVADLLANLRAFLDTEVGQDGHNRPPATPHSCPGPGP